MAVAAFPDLAEKLLPKDARRELVAQVTELGKTLRRETGTALGAVSGGARGLAATARETADTLDADFGKRLTDRLGTAGDTPSRWPTRCGRPRRWPASARRPGWR
nr:hypothetical protein GCM10020093_031340 [Planobispora longispora]